jgi:short-subunit dehydrogenase
VNAVAQARGWAVVTGASSGIGAEFVRKLARRGYPVLAVARRRERLAALKDEVERQGGARVEPLAEDLAADGSAARVVARALSLGPVELLVNNAGFGSWGPFVDLALERELEIVHLNISMVIELTHHLLPEMVRRRAGGVINVASTGAFQPLPFLATYAASKAFVVHFTEALAQELRPSGVRMLAICPGPTDSEFHAASGTGELVRRSPILMSAGRLVDHALDAYEGGRVLKIAGVLNALVAWLAQRAPRHLVRVIAGLLFRPRARPALRER